MNKDIVQCPDDFKIYKCKMSGVDSQNNIDTKESAPIDIAHNGMLISQPFIKLFTINLLFCLFV